jgi:divalent metal cation (Fe/Co/Zn/Cd) transporter
VLAVDEGSFLDVGSSVAQVERSVLVRTAVRLEWLTAAWMVIEAAVAIGSGVAAQSLTLMAFGADSIIELLSAGVLLWRLISELRDGEEFSRSAERRASKIGGALLLALALYVVASATWSLRSGRGQEFSIPGLALAAVAVPVMYFLAKAKLRIADQIDSRALRADAAESIACGYLSLIVVVGLITQAILSAWWVDGVSALVFVPFLLREAREAWASEDACGDD